MLGLALVMLLGTPGKAQVQVQRLGNELTKIAPTKKVTVDWTKLKDITKFQATGCDAIKYTCNCKEGGTIPNYAFIIEYKFEWHLDFGACNSWTDIDNALQSAAKEYCETAWSEMKGETITFISCSVIDRHCQTDHECKL